MADNVSVSGNNIATDDVGGSHYQYVKLAWGPNDTVNLVDDASGKRIPITGTVILGAGTSNIGDVDVLTLPGSLAGVAQGASRTTQPGVPVLATRADTAAAIDDNGEFTVFTVDDKNQLRVATLAALRTTDTISVAQATDAIMLNKTELTPKFAKLNAAANTANQTIVAAVTGKKIRVLSFRLMGAGTAGSATFRSGGTSDISETFNFDARSGMVAQFSPVGHFETVAGELLAVSTVTASATCGIGIVYVEV